MQGSGPGWEGFTLNPNSVYAGSPVCWAQEILCLSPGKHPHSPRLLECIGGGGLNIWSPTVTLLLGPAPLVPSRPEASIYSHLSPTLVPCLQ